MRDSAGFCASIRARRCRPRRESGLASNGCQRFSTGVGTDRSSKAKGFRDVGNGQSTVLTNLCAPQPVERHDYFVRPGLCVGDSNPGVTSQPTKRSVCLEFRDLAGWRFIHPRHPVRGAFDQSIAQLVELSNYGGLRGNFHGGSWRSSLWCRARFVDGLRFARRGLAVGGGGEGSLKVGVGLQLLRYEAVDASLWVAVLRPELTR